MKRVLVDLTVWITGVAIGIVFMIYRCGYLLENSQKRANKFFAYFNLMDRWMTGREQGYQFTTFFRENHIQSAAIYGMGKIGKHLKYELEKGGIDISYVVDEGENVIYGEENHYNLKDNLPMTEVVVVTPVYEYEDIKRKILSSNSKLKVVSIEKIIG